MTAGAARLFSYRIAGLRVSSDIELTGAVRGDDLEPAEVAIRTGNVPGALEGATAVGPTWQLAGESLLLLIPGVGRFHVRAGTGILYQADEGAAAVDLAVFLAGPVLALFLDLIGRTVFRASGVLAGGKAVLFCGPSGTGKSTLAAALVQRGYPLLLDDVCAVSLTPAPLAHSDTPWLKLWSRAIDRLDLGARRGAPLRTCLQKHYVDPVRSVPGLAPIGAVYNLRELRPPLVSGIEPPNSVDAVLTLRRNAFHPLIVQRLARTDAYFQMCAAIAHAARVFHLTRPLDFAELPQTTAMLERHWTEIGLLEAAA
jgi:hypothetical protein